LHAHPELGYEEEWTSNFVAKKLESFGLEIHRGLGKTGIVGVLKGLDPTLGGGGNKAIGLRADMDALPMTEENDFSSVIGKASMSALKPIALFPPPPRVGSSPFKTPTIPVFPNPL
jgi:metal-dependent amidase/aminoacylase/carboxypeptidase family protein